MTNPIILRRIKKLWDAGRIDADAMAAYVDSGIISQAEADEITGLASEP